MTETTRRISGGTHADTNARGEALAALQLWQVFEYLSPQKPPKPKLDKDTCIWSLNSQASSDQEMPWIDQKKIDSLEKLFKHRRRFVLFGGIISGPELVETVRELVGAPSIDFSEQRAPEGAASFMIPIDERGYVSGEIFISTVPWAVGCIQAQANGGVFDFSGFFGEDGIQQRVKDAVDALLKQRQLIEDEDGTEVTNDGSRRNQEDSSPQTDCPFSADADTVDSCKNVRTIDAEDVRKIAEVVFDECGWSPTSDVNWIIQTHKVPKNQEKQPDDPLNSFFAEELEKIQREYLAGKCGKTLSQYLETPVHPERCNLESTREHLVDGVHPSLTPKACWPGEHPLVTAQQFAVNAIMRDLQTEGLFSVNGPPGTGKTTMLKDILASIVLQRANVLETLDNPLDAFPSKLTIERHEYPVWKIHDKLQGFGIVVACANNGAAENISKELPGLSSIDKAVKIDYFSEVADSLGLPDGSKQRTSTSWGLVSAALGNQTNRGSFATGFWEGRRDVKKNQKTAQQPAQNTATATVTPAEPPDPMRPFTLQEWVHEFGSQVPTWSEAKKRYSDAKKRAETALRHTGELATLLRSHERLTSQIEQLTTEHSRLYEKLTDLGHRKDLTETSVIDARFRLERARNISSKLAAFRQCQEKLKIAQEKLTTILQHTPDNSVDEIASNISRVEQARSRVKEDLEEHNRKKPGILSSFCNREGKRRWETRNEVLQAELDAKRHQLAQLDQDKERVVRWHREHDSAKNELNTKHGQVRNVEADLKAHNIDASTSPADANRAEEDYQHLHNAFLSIQRDFNHATKAVQDNATLLQKKCDALKECEKSLSGSGLLNGQRNAWHLFDTLREDFHRAAPYHDELEVFHSRRDLFVAAMDLHKAFIVHSWKRLKTTLYAFIAMLQGKISPNQVIGGPMPLWDTFFLVVPLVSTTFASFPRLFRGIGQEQLAWVLIDEAGQASPQYCVGALWRAKRAVIVGDPIQLEPVVGVPEELVGPLQAHCGTHQRYVPPKASAQTMADLSNRYGTYLNESDADNRLWLGSPLVVHRRCISPMFEIANAIAYENKMVYGGGKDQLGATVPCSQWIDVSADDNDGHWIPSQGERVVRIVKKLVGSQLRNSEGKLRAFVITPFSKVAEKITDLLAREFSWKDAKEMCGTVHTFQGKEADFVVFLLGGDPKKPGVISTFAGKNPNLVNVAVTRAKKRLYVVGNRKYWTGRTDTHGYYRHTAEVLDEHRETVQAAQSGLAESAGKSCATT